MKRHSSAERALMRYVRRRVFERIFQEVLIKKLDEMFERELYGDPSSVEPVGILGTSPMDLTGKNSAAMCPGPAP